MTSSFEDVKELLARDKRLLEVTVLFNGQNLKERFPELSWEERTQLSRIARYMLGHSTGDGRGVESKEAGDVVSQVTASQAAARLEEPAETSDAQSDEAPTQVLRTEEPQADRVADQESSSPTPSTVLPKKAQDSEKLLGSEPRIVDSKAGRAKRRFYAALLAMVAVGIFLIILQVFWSSHSLLGWVFELSDGKRIGPAPVNHQLGTAETPQSTRPTIPAEAPIQPLSEVPEKSSSRNETPDKQTEDAFGTGISKAEQPDSFAEQPHEQPQAPVQGQEVDSLPASGLDQNSQDVSKTVGVSTPGEVRELQTTLIRRGYKPGPVDGILGPRTRAAIIAFQRDHDLPADGKLSASLMQALKSSIGSP
jgi:hypothetical protein